jgi:hypothetical protein
MNVKSKIYLGHYVQKMLLLHNLGLLSYSTTDTNYVAIAFPGCNIIILDPGKMEYIQP